MRLGLPVAATLWLVVTAGCDGFISMEGRKLLQDASGSYNRGEDAEAIAASNSLLKMHPKLQEAGEAHYIRGLAKFRTNQRQAAKADLLAALELTKRDDLKMQAHATLADLYYQDGDLAESEKQYNAVMNYCRQGAPPADEALYRLGTIYQRQGRWHDADLKFERLGHLFEGSDLAKLGEARCRATRWSIQAGALFTSAKAQDIQTQLNQAGFTSRLDFEIRNGRLMRLVRLGNYNTYEAGGPDLKRLQRVCPDAYLVPAK